MWPLYLIVSKLLKMEGQEGEEEYPLQFFSSKTYGVISPRSHSVDVPHVRQLCNWDCGLACVLMVLRTLGIDSCGIHDLGELCSTTSIWTVDLAYLLHKFSVSFSFFTVTLGANPDFSAETFYRGLSFVHSMILLGEHSFTFLGEIEQVLVHAVALSLGIQRSGYTLGRAPNRLTSMWLTLEIRAFCKEQLQDDLGRVDRLFEKALEAGIRIQRRSISGEEISTLILSGQYIVVALVDKIKLSQSWLKDICVSGCYVGVGGSDYMGHYVVICGYDADTDEFEIRDPASPRKYDRVSLECLEEARKSFGTDEDILLVSLNGKGGKKLSPKHLPQHTKCS